jgi:hypothetical protein
MINPDFCDDSTGEYFEVKNVTSGTLSLDYITVADNANSSSLTAINGDLLIDAGQSVIFSASSWCYAGLAGVEHYEYSSLALSNSGDVVTISSGSVSTITIDTVDYNAWGSPTAGAAWQLDPSFTDSVSNDSEGNWCLSTGVIAVGQDFGSPGADNHSCAGDTADTGNNGDTGDTSNFSDTDTGWMLDTSVMLEDTSWGNWGDSDTASIDTGTSFADSGLNTDTGSSLTTSDLILSEICDHADNANARFVEIYNPNSAGTIDLSTWTVERYANGQTTSDSVALSGTLAAGDRYVVAMNETEFTTTFGSGIVDQTSGNISGNGDDVYTLTNSGAVIDIYGVVGVDGTGEAWEYTDSIATRNASSFATSIWNATDWTITSGVGDASPGQ